MNHLVRTLLQVPEIVEQNPCAAEIILFAHRISAGFPSPAADHAEEGLDLNDYLIRNKADIGGATRAMICREITEHFAKHGDTEWDCDRDSWFSVIAALSPQNTDKT